MPITKDQFETRLDQICTEFGATTTGDLPSKWNALFECLKALKMNIVSAGSASSPGETVYRENFLRVARVSLQPTDAESQLHGLQAFLTLLKDVAEDTENCSGILKGIGVKAAAGPSGGNGDDSALLFSTLEKNLFGASGIFPYRSLSQGSGIYESANSKFIAHIVLMLSEGQKLVEKNTITELPSSSSSSSLLSSSSSVTLPTSSPSTSTSISSPLLPSSRPSLSSAAAKKDKVTPCGQTGRTALGYGLLAAPVLHFLITMFVGYLHGKDVEANVPRGAACPGMCIDNLDRCGSLPSLNDEVPPDIMSYAVDVLQYAGVLRPSCKKYRTNGATIDEYDAFEGVIRGGREVVRTIVNGCGFGLLGTAFGASFLAAITSPQIAKALSKAKIEWRGKCKKEQGCLRTEAAELCYIVKEALFRNKSFWGHFAKELTCKLVLTAPFALYCFVVSKESNLGIPVPDFYTTHFDDDYKNSSYTSCALGLVKPLLATADGCASKAYEYYASSVMGYVFEWLLSKGPGLTLGVGFAAMIVTYLLWTYGIGKGSCNPAFTDDHKALMGESSVAERGGETDVRVEVLDDSSTPAAGGYKEVCSSLVSPEEEAPAEENTALMSLNTSALSSNSSLSYGSLEDTGAFSINSLFVKEQGESVILNLSMGSSSPLVMPSGNGGHSYLSTPSDLLMQEPAKTRFLKEALFPATGKESSSESSTSNSSSSSSSSAPSSSGTSSIMTISTNLFGSPSASRTLTSIPSPSVPVLSPPHSPPPKQSPFSSSAVPPAPPVSSRDVPPSPPVSSSSSNMVVSSVTFFASSSASNGSTTSCASSSAASSESPSDAPTIGDKREQSHNDTVIHNIKSPK